MVELVHNGCFKRVHHAIQSICLVCNYFKRRTNFAHSLHCIFKMCLYFGDLAGFTEGGTGHFHHTRVDTSLASDLQGGTDHRKMVATLEVDLAKCVSFVFKHVAVVLYCYFVVYLNMCMM